MPLGGKKGLFQWELLIMQLYPWLSVRETSTNELAVEEFIVAQAVNTNAHPEKRPVAAKPAETKKEPAKQNQEVKKAPEKKSFLQRLLKK